MRIRLFLTLMMCAAALLGVSASGHVGLAQSQETDRIQPLVPSLSSLDKNVREKAYRSLVEIGGSKAVELLLRGLRDNSEDVRLAVVEALGQVKDPLATRGVTEAVLAETNNTVQHWAWHAVLASKDPAAFDYLAGSLNSPDPERRKKALPLIRELGTSRSYEPILSLLSREKDASVREAAILELGRLKDNRAVDFLMTALVENRRGCRENAAWALGRIKDPRAVDALIRVLADGEDSVRFYAYEALASIKDPRAIAPLVSAIKNEREKKGNAGLPLTRWARYFQQFGDPRVVDAWLAALKEKESDVRARAAYFLGRLSDVRAVEPLVAALRDKDADVRWYAAQALGFLKDARAVEPLVASLKDDSKDVRAEAARALGVLHDPRAVRPLIDLLADKDPGVRWVAGEALGVLGDKESTLLVLAALLKVDLPLGSAGALPFDASLYDREGWKRIFAFQEAWQYWDVWAVSHSWRDIGYFEELFNSLQTSYPGTPPSTWSNRGTGPLIVDLGALGDTSETAIAALRDSDSEVRWRAAALLAGSLDPGTVDTLISAMKDSSRAVRNRSAASLWVKKDPKGNAVLAAAFVEPKGGLLWTMKEWLGTISDSRVTDVLLAALKDPNKFARRRAAYLLGVLKEPKAVEPLISLLGDKDAVVQFAAAYALAATKDPRAVEPLVSTLAEMSRGAKFDACLVRWSAANVLGAFGDARAVPALIPLLKDPVPGMPRAAARSLGMLKDAAAINPLVAALTDERSFWGTLVMFKEAAAAGRSLGLLKDPRALDALMAAAKDTSREVRWEAVRALDGFNDPRMILPLIAAVKDKDEPVRSEAARVLAKFDDPRVSACLLASASDPWVVAGAYRFFIARGIERNALVDALYLRGDAAMIQDYVNCGEPLLKDFAEHLALRFSFKPVENPDKAVVRWGQTK